MAVLNDGSNLDRDKYLRLLEIQGDLRRQIVTKLPAKILLMQCRTCGEIKTINHYRKAVRGYYGLDARCTPCRRARVPKHKVVMEGSKSCKKCLHKKPLYAFLIDRRCPDGRTARCHQCIQAAKEHRALQQIDRPGVEQVRRRQTLDLAIKYKLANVPDFDIKQCRTCLRVCGVWHFYSQVQNADGLETRCDDCQRGYET